ncbi:MAG TPA: NBR1-Ig-like domain-containing protein, partial [Anaerolineales bacterium]|nr:NBR1-Ig-like domain-containing protein [Anaerolineales bacterium]
MSEKSFVATSLIVFMLSACTGQTPTPTLQPSPSETSPPTITQTPAATNTPTITLTPHLTNTSLAETSAVLPTATHTPVLPQPTNPPDCTNSASFVTDVTIPDNSDVIGNTIFTKTWRVRNTGTCVWGSGYTLTHYSDEQMSAPAAVPLDVTQPGEEVDISVDLQAPNSVGTHRGNFVIKNPAGLIMQIDQDSRLWVIINVTNTVTSTPTVTSTSTPVATNGTVTSTSTASAANVDDDDSAFVAVTCPFSRDAAKVTETINAINAYREQNGLSPYTLNTQLERAAQAHANDMACNNLFVHTGSDKSTPHTRVTASRYLASSVSENVYGSYPPLTGPGVVQWWRNDQTDKRHNLNLLSSTFMEIGVGYSFYDNFGYYVVVFAAPKTTV